MKPKIFCKKKIIYIYILWIISAFSLTNCDKEQENKIRNESQYESEYKNNQYVMAQISKPPEYFLQQRAVIPLLPHEPGTIMQQPLQNPLPCPCANQIRCRPCDVIANIDAQEYITPMPECPCASRPSCPVCPPLSLIHEIASKKVYI